MKMFKFQILPVFIGGLIFCFLIPAYGETRCFPCEHVRPLTEGKPSDGFPNPFLCRWDTNRGNPYLRRFRVCEPCSIAFLPDHTPLYESSPFLARPHSTLEVLIKQVQDDPVLKPLKPLLLGYAKLESIEPSPFVRIEYLWPAICGLERFLIPYPDPSWEKTVSTLFQHRIRRWMKTYPVWRWYEAMAYFLSHEALNRKKAEFLLIASDLMRKTGYIQKARSYFELSSPDIPSEEVPFRTRLRVLLDIETLFRDHMYRMLLKLSPGQCEYEDLLYLRSFLAFEQGQWQKSLQFFEEWLSCPSWDPVIMKLYGEPLLQNIWLTFPDARKDIQSYLLHTPLALWEKNHAKK